MSNDYGVKVSRPGADVFSAIDTLLNYSSSWPALKIHDTGVVNVPSMGQITIPHTLGYYPVVILFASEPSNASRTAMNNLSCSTSDIRIENYYATTVAYRYIIFRQNLEEQFIAPRIQGSSSLGDFNIDYGIKATIPGSPIDTSDPRHFSVHSGYVSPLIHMVDNGVASVGSIWGYQKPVSHNLGYTPAAISFYRESGSNRYLFTPYISQGISAARYEVTSSQVLQYGDNFFLPAAPRFGCVIFKNPLQQSTINVTYP